MLLYASPRPLAPDVHGTGILGSSLIRGMSEDLALKDLDGVLELGGLYFVSSSPLVTGCRLTGCSLTH